MCASGWPTPLLLFCLIGSANPSPVSIHTPAPPLPSQISPPFPTNLPPLPSHFLSITTPIPSHIGSSGESPENISCHLTVSPSILVVRFGDPVTANCSVQRTGFVVLGWEVSLAPPKASTDPYVVWSVDRMTEWSINPMCYVLNEQMGQCDIGLPVIVYKPPDNVYISFVSHSGPLLEGHQYTLHCTVQDVAPVENLTVTFYRGQTALGQLQSKNTEKTPVTEIFTLNITASDEDDEVQYWCEAKLELGSEGPQYPPVVMSQNLTATVLFLTKGLLGQKNFTVEVDVLAGSGTANSCNRHVFLAVLIIQMIKWL